MENVIALMLVQIKQVGNDLSFCMLNLLLEFSTLPSLVWKYRFLKLLRDFALVVTWSKVYVPLMVSLSELVSNLPSLVSVEIYCI